MGDTVCCKNCLHWRSPEWFSPIKGKRREVGGCSLAYDCNHSFLGPEYGCECFEPIAKSSEIDPPAPGEETSAEEVFEGKREEILVLKKDIVIPAGTIFRVAPVKSINHGGGHFSHVFGLTDDSYGTVDYHVDLDNQDDLVCLEEWFLLP